MKGVKRLTILFTWKNLFLHFFSLVFPSTLTSTSTSSSFVFYFLFLFTLCSALCLIWIDSLEKKSKVKASGKIHVMYFLFFFLFRLCLLLLALLPVIFILFSLSRSFSLFFFSSSYSPRSCISWEFTGNFFFLFPSHSLSLIFDGSNFNCFESFLAYVFTFYSKKKS